MFLAASLMSSKGSRYTSRAFIRFTYSRTVAAAAPYWLFNLTSSSVVEVTSPGKVGASEG